MYLQSTMYVLQKKKEKLQHLEIFNLMLKWQYSESRWIIAVEI